MKKRIETPRPMPKDIGGRSGMRESEQPRFPCHWAGDKIKDRYRGTKGEKAGRRPSYANDSLVNSTKDLVKDVSQGTFGFVEEEVRNK